MAQLLRLAGRRLIALPFMILGITLLVFIILQFAPTDPATNAHRHSNPITDCSDQKRKIRKRNKKKAKGKGGDR